LFDLSHHVGARRVKAVLGVHAGHETETLGCSLSYLFDLSAALSEIADAIKLLPSSGPNNTVTTEHRILHERVEKSSTLLKGVIELLDERFCLLMATANSPNNKSLLSALTARIRSSSFDAVLSNQRVRVAYQELEAQRAEALFKAAAKARNLHTAFQLRLFWSRLLLPLATAAAAAWSAFWLSRWPGLWTRTWSWQRS
jgi:mRNA deadenylase 3'-5' endonuclease subunit Ccr4